MPVAPPCQHNNSFPLGVMPRSLIAWACFSIQYIKSNEISALHSQTLLILRRVSCDSCNHATTDGIKQSSRHCTIDLVRQRSHSKCTTTRNPAHSLEMHSPATKIIMSFLYSFFLENVYGGGGSCNPHHSRISNSPERILQSVACINKLTSSSCATGSSIGAYTTPGVSGL